jgi:hypothetical protein
MKRLRESASIWAWLAAGAVGLFTLGAVGFAWRVWGWSWMLTDRLTAIAATFALAALVDAAIAAIVAVAAYYQATRRPDLWLLAGLFRDSPQQVARRGDPSPKSFKFDRLQSNSPEIVEFHLHIDNRSKYTGRNPALRVIPDPECANAGEQPIRADWVISPDRDSLQWDGGADFAAHGTWIRPLPILQLTVRGMPRDKPYEFRFELVAEGFRQDFVLPIRFAAR